MPKKKLQEELYLSLIELLFNSHSGHIGSCLSCMDILIQTWLFEMKPEDTFILSKGHAAPALYIVLNKLGIISNKDLQTFHKDATKLPAHTPNGHYKKEIPFPTGSLGHGLSLSCGIAEGLIHQGRISSKVYCLVSDGECNEGQLWEAAQFASARKLSNLIILIDRNQIQALGFTKDVLGDGASRSKWEAFDFEVYECNGHDLNDLELSFKKLKRSRSDKPKVLICNTKKGYLLPDLENTVDCHYLPLSEEEYRKTVVRVREKYA